MACGERKAGLSDAGSFIIMISRGVGGVMSRERKLEFAHILDLSVEHCVCCVVVQMLRC